MLASVELIVFLSSYILPEKLKTAYTKLYIYLLLFVGLELGVSFQGKI